MSSPANICAELKEVEYQATIPGALEVFNDSDLLNGDLSSKSSFIIRLNGDEYAISQWISPKRTRSYPFARVYDTLCKKNRVALIPFCKDEGADGERDFIQWDTVSLMSLLNVHVIICYYVDAEKNRKPNQSKKHKITKQIRDYHHIHQKLGELQNYQSSALHWNLKQMEELSNVAELTLVAYRKISEQLNVRIHSEKGINDRITTLNEDIAKFRKSSRELAQKAQHRESLTTQPKEKVVGRKANVTITNLLGGAYYLTADEFFVLDGYVFLVEKKHSNQKWLPSIYDIKDAFIKSALFSNIRKLKYNDKEMPCLYVVGLTSKTIQGVFHSKMQDPEVVKFFNDKNTKESDQEFIRSIINETQQNNFGVFAINENDVDILQQDILRELICPNTPPPKST